MELPSWFRQRRYIHFDEALSLKKAEKLVSNPVAVARHPFWPLIKFTVNTPKLKRDKTTGVLIKKPKLREIAYAAHGDSQIFSYYCADLSSKYEAEIESRDLTAVVLAFRSLKKSNIEFARDAFDEIRARGDCCAVALDITGFFDNLDHSQLKSRWKALLDVKELPPDHFAVFRALTKYASVDRDIVFETLGISVHNPRSERRRICTPEEFNTTVRGTGLVHVNLHKSGIPQGTAISAMLSNLYMLDFDTAAQRFALENGGRYMRYCDDILFIMPPGMSGHSAAFADAEIKKLKLEINPMKTAVSEFRRSAGSSTQTCSAPLQYLGFLFDGHQVIIRSAAFAKFSNRMKRGVSLAKQTMRSRNKTRAQTGAEEHDLYKKQIFSRYSHLGGRNFLRYGYRAAKAMNSPAIKRQLRPLWKRLTKAIEN